MGGTYLIRCSVLRVEYHDPAGFERDVEAVAFAGAVVAAFFGDDAFVGVGAEV